ncbi:MAG: InlB B-repeat-containing protein [Roseburia sp.]
MKKKKVMTALFLTAAMMAGTMMLGGCGNNAEESVADTEQTAGELDSGESAAVHTVTFYDSDGTTVLATEEVADGECVEEFTPEKDGYIFVGWFATPQMSHRFDYTLGITDDTSVFAGFVSYVEDDREFAIVGSGTSPVLVESNWGKVIGEAQMMTKEDCENANIYTITVDLNAGDEFQFAINTEWNHQRGYGYLETISQDGVEYFKNSGGLGETSTKRSNIKCAISGNYTFTLTTYPGEDVYETDNANYKEDNKEAFNINPYDTITWTYNGEGQSANADVQTDYYIKGATITGWEDVYSDETRFTEVDGIYTLTIDLTEGDEFLFTTMVTVDGTESVGTEYVRYSNIASDDTESLAVITEGSDYNMVAAKAGTYTFTYDPSTQVLTASCK